MPHSPGRVASWYQPANRQWWWWDATITGEYTADIVIDRQGEPAMWDDFKLLLVVSRAARAEIDEVRDGAAEPGDAPPHEMPRSPCSEPSAGCVEREQVIAQCGSVASTTATSRRRYTGQRVTVAGMVMASRPVRTRTGERMGFVSLCDESGVAELLLFPRLVSRARQVLEAPDDA